MAAPLTTGAIMSTADPSRRPGVPPRLPPPPPPPGAAELSTKAVWALILPIVCPGPGSLAGIWLGWSARREIAASRGREIGAPLAQAGMVVGVVGGLGILLTVAFVRLLVGALGSG
jgi:hypothetical protein